MPYPNITQYKDAVGFAESFKTLNGDIQVVRNGRDPVFASGNFAVVFKMWHRGKPKALKCFTKDVYGRKQRQLKISNYIKEHDSLYFIDYQYLDNEIWVDYEGGKEFPVGWMDWIDARTLGNVIKTYCELKNTDALQELSIRFKEFAIWILDKDFAHGDIKHDNILVDAAGNLKMVDYDGMYIPELSGESATEIGGKDYQHPARSNETFNRHIDDFSLLVVYTSILALTKDPELFKEFNNDQNIIFTKLDFDDFENSNLVKRLRKIDGLNDFLDLMSSSLSNDSINIENLSFVLAGIMSAGEFKKRLWKTKQDIYNRYNELTRLLDQSFILEEESFNKLNLEILINNELLVDQLKNLENLLIEGENKINSIWWNNLSNEWKELFLYNLGYNNDNKISEQEILKEINNLSNFSINFRFSHKINDLEPLRYITGIKHLTIQISKFDLEPISNLYNLSKLVLTNNNSNLEPITRLKKLKRLKLNSNEADISVLSKCKQLEELELKWNNKPLDPIGKLTNLKNLILTGNKADISPIKGLLMLIARKNMANLSTSKAPTKLPY